MPSAPQPSLAVRPERRRSRSMTFAGRATASRPATSPARPAVAASSSDCSIPSSARSAVGRGWPMGHPMAADGRSMRPRGGCGSTTGALNSGPRPTLHRHWAAAWPPSVAGRSSTPGWRIPRRSPRVVAGPPGRHLRAGDGSRRLADVDPAPPQRSRRVNFDRFLTLARPKKDGLLVAKPPQVVRVLTADSPPPGKTLPGLPLSRRNRTP